MDAKLIGRGEDERTAETTEIKGARGELVVTEFLYPPGKSGPDTHIHREHADCFWVLEGELTVELGPEGEARRIGPGEFALAPPEVVHTFRNEGPGETRFINIHAPGKGFDEHLRALRDGTSSDFDTFDPPEDGGRPVTDALVLEVGEGEDIRFGPAGITINAGREHEPGGLTLTEGTLPPGFPGPVLHVHDRTVDSFYVLEGTLTVRLAEDTAEAGPGTYVLVPPGAVHSFANTSDEQVRLLNIMGPGGFENYFREASRALPPDGPPDPGLLARIASNYDFRPAA